MPLPFEFRRISVPVDAGETARSRVRETAGALIDWVKSREPSWSPPPFDPELYARHLGVSIAYEPGPVDWDALLVPVVDPPLIICNSAIRSPLRRRFSLAHEIAHLFFDDAEATYHLRSQDRARYEDSDAARVLERLVDAGAADLLMPGERFAADLASLGMRASTVVALSERYAVSLQAAAIRTVEACERPCAVGFFEYADRPSWERARVLGAAAPPPRFAYRAKRVFHGSGFPFLFPFGKSVPDDSVICRASLSRHELEAEEPFGGAGRVAVSAVALDPIRPNDAPPLVCAVFRAGRDLRSGSPAAVAKLSGRW